MDNIKYTRPRAGQVAHVLARIQTPAPSTAGKLRYTPAGEYAFAVPVSSVLLLSSNVYTHC